MRGTTSDVMEDTSIHRKVFTAHSIDDILSKDTTKHSIKDIVSNTSDTPLKLSIPTSSQTSTGSKMFSKKKMRTTFTGRQIFELERRFENKKYISASERVSILFILQSFDFLIGTAFLLLSLAMTAGSWYQTERNNL